MSGRRESYSTPAYTCPVCKKPVKSGGVFVKSHKCHSKCANKARKMYY